MNNLLTKLIGDKKDWKRMEARAAALPPDYRIVYGEMKSYMWRFTAGDGMDIVEILREVLGEFEAAAAEGKRVLDVTGPDVAAYCDARLPQVPTYLDRWRASLNGDVRKKLAADGSRA
ncbi:DUF1048 domain-containing protein [Cellulomonas alba]|uniref:DUF1048 domain-containing protein n=1 Tax=Cellulomonas alba TaxID=3053467 RepID=A0ABT7SF44_9CELL|nr:DUF1048 domain-containing protein [Cellulomonas alba]MDM7854810.1 DUF1048 domain-containing protein [Cellulomonas alba]